MEGIHLQVNFRVFHKFGPPILLGSCIFCYFSSILVQLVCVNNGGGGAQW